MAGEMFYAADTIEQIAINLFYGWGYNFYKVENQLRADDQMIRSKSLWLLGEAATAVSTAESDVPPRISARALARQAVSRCRSGCLGAKAGAAAWRARRARAIPPSIARAGERSHDAALSA